MRRLARILACAAALAGGTALLSCAFFHGDYPSSSGACEKTTDCFANEVCIDAGVCVPGDAGPQEDGGDGGGQ